MQSPPKVLEQQCQIMFSQYTEYFWGWDKKMNTKQEFSISAFISWYLHLDVLNYLRT